jgi:hypothetical protein
MKVNGLLSSSVLSLLLAGCGGSGGNGNVSDNKTKSASNDLLDSRVPGQDNQNSHHAAEMNAFLEEQLHNNTDDLFNSIKDYIPENLKNKFVDLGGGKLLSLATGAISTVKMVVGTAATAVGLISSSAFISTMATAAGAYLAYKYGGTVKNAVKSTVSNITTGVSNAVQSSVSAVTGAATNAVTTVVDPFVNASAAVKHLWGSLSEKTREAFFGESAPYKAFNLNYAAFLKDDIAEEDKKAAADKLLLFSQALQDGQVGLGLGQRISKVLTASSQLSFYVDQRKKVSADLDSVLFPDYAHRQRAMTDEEYKAVLTQAEEKAKKKLEAENVAPPPASSWWGSLQSAASSVSNSLLDQFPKAKLALLPFTLYKLQSNVRKLMAGGLYYEYLLRIDERSLEQSLNDFFDQDMRSGGKLLLTNALTDKDDGAQKLAKRKALQDVFLPIVQNSIFLDRHSWRAQDDSEDNLKFEETREIGSLNKILKDLESTAFSSETKELFAQIQKTICKLYNIYPGIKVSVKNSEGVTVEQDLKDLLTVIIPQGFGTGTTEEEKIASIQGYLDKDAIEKAFLNTPSQAISLASDVISTRDSRSHQGRVNLSQLTINGNTGGAWTLDQALYVSAKGTVENKTTDNLNGVVSYNFNGFTLGSTYAFENSKEVSNYAGSVLASKSFASNLFVEFQSGFEKEGTSVLSTQKYTIGADLTFGSPFVQLDHVAGQGARGFVGCDFGSLTLKTDDAAAVGISGLAKVDVLTGAPVISTGVNFITHHGVSLSSTINVHSELSADVSVDISR